MATPRMCFGRVPRAVVVIRIVMLNVWTNNYVGLLPTSIFYSAAGFLIGRLTIGINGMMAYAQRTILTRTRTRLALQ